MNSVSKFSIMENFFSYEILWIDQHYADDGVQNDWNQQINTTFFTK